MAEQSQQQSQPAAAKAPEKIVLVHEYYDPDRNLLPVGTVLDPSLEWVRRCVMPTDLWQTKRLYEAERERDKAVAEATKLANEAIEKARKEAP